MVPTLTAATMLIFPGDRRGSEAREGRPGAESLPADIHVLVVDDG